LAKFALNCRLRKSQVFCTTSRLCIPRCPLYTSAKRFDDFDDNLLFDPKPDWKPEPVAAPAPTDTKQYIARLGSKGRKYVRYNFFKDTHYIDLRELFEKEGRSFPTRKGIMMTKGSMSQLLKMFDKIDEKVEFVKAGKSTEELLAVVDSIHVKVYTFRSMILIDVGSYYSRDGEEKRGKGLSMTEEQYASLKFEANNIRTVLDDFP